MMVIETEKNGLCFVGDIHGEFKSLRWLMKYTEFRDTTYIICGDCGFGFHKSGYYEQTLSAVDKIADIFNCDILFLRGNHDDKSYFIRSMTYGKHIKTIPDYTVLKTPLHNVLCVGGAISIDRTYRLGVWQVEAVKYAAHHRVSEDEAERLCPRCYWEDEKPVYDEDLLNEINTTGIKIDIVCTHTSPSFCEPLTKDNLKDWAERDEHLIEDVDDERKVMTDLYNKLQADGHPIVAWFYGHYHYHHTDYINNIKFVMLDRWRNGTFDFYDVH